MTGSTIRATLGALLCFAATAALALSPPEPIDTLTIRKGQSLLIEYLGLTRVSVGDGALVEVETFPDRNEVLLIARDAGTTDLRLWDGGDQPERYLVVVHDENGAASIRVEELRVLLGELHGVEIIEAAGETVIRGRARNQDDYDHVAAVAARYDNVASYLHAPSFDRVPTVMLQAKMLEVRTSALKDLGVDWDKFVDGPVFGYLNDFRNASYRLTSAPDGSELALDGVGGQTFAGISTSITSTINLLVENGDARLLAEPNLSCISGGTADFLAGGEVPIPIRDENGFPSVEFKEFGIILRFAPLVDPDRFIRTDVQVEVSAVDQSIAVLGVPGFLTRKSNTLMNLGEGQTMVIAGLVSRDDAKNVSKLPLLGQIPVLGELFKSRQFRRQKSELVILVTPRIIDHNSPLNREYRDRYDKLLDTSDQALRYRIGD